MNKQITHILFEIYKPHSHSLSQSLASHTTDLSCQIEILFDHSFVVYIQTDLCVPYFKV